MLIDKRYVELIDVRPKKDFEKVHALVARSIPLSEFEPHSVLAHRKLDKSAPLYIMCRKKTLALLAACSLAGAGLDEPIVVEGGIEAWEGQGLPVVRKKSWQMPVMNVPPTALLAGFTVGLSLAFHHLFFLGTLFVLAAWAAPHAFRFAHGRYRDVDDNRLGRGSRCLRVGMARG
jgi:rhodanese-related sulfurtransferase